MNRRKFLQSIAWLTGGLLFTKLLSAKSLGINGQQLTGVVKANGKGIKDVVVSDGYSVVQTDKKGRYSITAHPDAQAIFISTPAGYHFINENNIARHYYLLQNVQAGQDINFELRSLGKNDDEHEFII